jgi:hypothetical protein
MSAGIYPGPFRPFLGGSWFDVARVMRSIYPIAFAPAIRDAKLSIRFVRRAP